MEASCSGRCACNAALCRVPTPRRSAKRHVQTIQAHLCRADITQTNPLAKAATASCTKRKHGQISVAALGSGEVVEVEELHGVRIIGDAKQRPQVQYLVKWKDGTPDTWQVLAAGKFKSSTASSSSS